MVTGAVPCDSPQGSVVEATSGTSRLGAGYGGLSSGIACPAGLEGNTGNPAAPSGDWMSLRGRGFGTGASGLPRLPELPFCGDCALGGGVPRVRLPELTARGTWDEVVC